MTSLILQYRANSGMCSHRSFGPSNQTQFNGGWVYTSDVAVHEWLLRSPHRVADGRDADYFYVPLYLSCLMNPVYDYTGADPNPNPHPNPNPNSNPTQVPRSPSTPETTPP